MNRRNFTALSIIICTLSGCATVRPDSADVMGTARIPENWAMGTAAGQSPEPAWWTEFADPNLDRLVAHALGNNRSLRASGAALDVALAEARIAGADLYPQIGAGLSTNRTRQNVAAPPSSTSGRAPTPVTAKQFGASLEVSWELDIWGSIRNRSRAATLDAQAQQTLFDAAAQSLAAQVVKAWFAILEADLQLKLSHVTVKTFVATEKQAQDRVSTGLRAPDDSYLAQANLAAAQARLYDRQRLLESAKRQIQILLGQYPDADVAVGGSFPAMPGEVVAGIPADLLQRRPDVIGAERRMESAGFRLAASRADRFPRLSLTASGGTVSDELSKLTSGDFLVWSIAGNLVQPLFQAGRLNAHVTVSEARQQEAISNFAQTALTAFQEVETFLAAEKYLRLRALVLEHGATAAQSAAAIANHRYVAGVDSLLPVLESQRRSLDTQSAHLSATRQLLDNRVDLYLALGGGTRALTTLYQSDAPANTDENATGVEHDQS